MPSKLVTSSYPHLLNKIKNTIDTGRRQIELTKALTYWRIGENISKHLLNHNGRAGYGKQLYINLSRDLKVNQRTLYQSTRFYKKFPKLSAGSNLDWGHYRKLITVDDPHLRGRLLQKAKKNKLTTRQLTQEIRSTTRRSKSFSKLIPKRGPLYVYKLIDISGLLEVDCGFSITRALPLTGIKDAKAGMRVVSTKTGNGFRFSPFKGIGGLYTYKAGSVRVVDGDTLSCRVDCGFQTKIKRTLRLRGINAPEIKTAAGLASKHFVQRQLRGKKEIIFRSYGIDNYGRYVVDVFYNSEKNGDIYLNQEILNAGFAKRYV